jgi:hypothetical protein
MGDDERQHGAGTIRHARDTGSGPGRRLRGEPAVPPPPLDHALAADDDDQAGGGDDGRIPENGGDGTRIDVQCFIEAAQLLEGVKGGPIGTLNIDVYYQLVFHANEQATGFRRFVAALERGEDGGRAVRSIRFVTVDWALLPEEPAVRLFGVALPSHPTLVSVAFCLFDVPLRYVKLFQTTHAPMELRFVSGTVDRERARAIADLLLRNVRLSSLEVNPVRFGYPIRFGSGPMDAPMDADSCQIICRAASQCKNLGALKIRANEIRNDMLDNVAASSSSLSEVWVEGAFSEASVANLATQLRTNTTMTRLFLFHTTRAPPSSEEAERFRPIANVLDTFNFTLKDVVVDLERPGSAVVEKIHELVLRNRRIRTALEHWQTRSYHVAPAGLQPTVLGRVSRFPTLLYRFVRQGDLNELCDRLLLQRRGGSAVLGRNKRSRATRSGQ